MRTKKERQFIHLSCLFSVLHALGYVLLGINTQFNLCIIMMIILDLFYIPAVTLRSVKIFPVYLVVFSVILIFITAFIQTKLFNNYSALLCLFVAILIKPKFKNIFMAIYLIFSTIALCLAKDPIYYLLIHYSRTLWIFIIYDFIIYVKYERKPIILFEEEIEILEQLSNNLLIKEIELNGMSDRTIRRRIDAAKKRNGLKTTDELKELYRKTYKKS